VCGGADASALARAKEVAGRAGDLLSGLAGRRPPLALPVDRDGATVDGGGPLRSAQRKDAR
jgi:hypothetical protein